MSQVLTELAPKWKHLKDWQQSMLQNYLAGNRNGNVLFALMDNWEAYEKMLSQYENAEGSALEKNAKYTESWAAATDNLKTSWAELLSTITDNGELQKEFVRQIGDAVKEANGLLKQWKDEDAYKASHGYWEWDDYGAYRWVYDEEMAKAAEAQEAARLAAEKYQKDGEKLTKTINEQTNAIITHTESTETDTDAVEKSATAFEKQRDRISEVAKAIKEEKNDAVNSLADIYKAAMEAADKGYYGSNAYRQGGALFFSEKNLDQLEKEGKLSAREYLDAYFKEIDSGDYSTAAANFFGKITGGTNEIQDDNKRTIASMRDLGDSFEWTFDKGTMSMDEYLQSLSSSTGISETFWASMIESLGMYSDELAKWTESNGEVETKAEIDTEEAEAKADSLWDKYEKLREDVVTKANALTKKAQSDTQALIDILAKVPRQITSSINVVVSRSGYGQEGADTPTVASESGSYYGGYSGGGGGTQLLYEEGASAILGRMGYASGKRDSYSGIALVNDEYPANGSKPELIISPSTGSAYIANGGRPALVNLASDDIVLTASETRSAFGVPGFAIGKSAKSGGESTKSTALTATIAKKSAKNGATGTAAEAATDPTETWNQLKKLIDYMIEEQKGILDQNLKVLDKQLEELEASRKAQKEEDELAQKQLAVDEALLDLQKAQNERTVRYYNESTHQWEWMADQGVLAQAEEAYSDALKELKDFLSELDFNEQKAAIQAQKDALQEAFDAYKEGWDTIVKSIEKPTGDLNALFEELKVNGTDAMKAQAGNIESLLSALETGFFYGIGDVTDAATSGVSVVVQKANEFLDSVKKSETATAAEKSVVKTSSGGGGGGGSSGGGGSVLSSTTGSTASKTLSSIISGGISKVAGATSAVKSAVGAITYKATTSASTVNNNGNNTYINGVKIGGDSLSQPLGKVLATLNLHANYTK